jgi:type II restriction enzyme
MDRVPAVGRIAVVEERRARAKEFVLEQWRRLAFLHDQNIAGRGWLIEVMRCVDLIGRSEFSLAEVYSFEDRLARMYPGTAHVRQKIRQQLQVLRDGGYLEFLGKGAYRLRAFEGARRLAARLDKGGARMRLSARNSAHLPTRRSP